MLSNVAASKVNAASRVLDGETLVDGARVRTSITNVKNHTCREAAGVQTQHTRWMEEKLGNLEILEEDLSSSDSVTNGVIGRLRQQHWVFSGINLELLENVSPNSLHILPVLDDTVLHWIAQLEYSLEFFLQPHQRLGLRDYLYLPPGSQ